MPVLDQETRVSSTSNAIRSSMETTTTNADSVTNKLEIIPPLVEPITLLHEHLDRSVLPLSNSLSNSTSIHASSSAMPIETFISTADVSLFNTCHSNLCNTVDSKSIELALPIVENIDDTSNELDDSCQLLLVSERSNIDPIQANSLSSVRRTTPRNVHIVDKHLETTRTSFLYNAQHWAERTHTITYTHLLQTSIDAAKQMPTRRIAAHLRKIPELDSNILSKFVRSQSREQVRRFSRCLSIILNASVLTR
jgi:hypothetical protein